MKRLLLAILLTVGMASLAEAGSIQGVADNNTPTRITMTVYNDSGAALTSGDVVVWDNDDTEFDRSLAPYVTTTTTGDEDWVAGVVLDDAIAIGGQGEIVIYGPAWTRVAMSTDVAAEDTTVSTTTVAGRAGDWGAGANTCYLGILMENYDRYLRQAMTTDNAVLPVFVNPGCED